MKKKVIKIITVSLIMSLLAGMSIYASAVSRQPKVTVSGLISNGVFNYDSNDDNTPEVHLDSQDLHNLKDEIEAESNKRHEDDTYLYSELDNLESVCR